MDVDRVFIINLKHRTDRKEQVLKELERLEIKNFEFFDAIQPKTQEDLDNWHLDFLKERPGWLRGTDEYYLKYKLGALGCMRSHIEIMKIALERNYSKILILEDDTKFAINPQIKTYANIAKNLTPQLKNINYGILYLGGTHREMGLSRKTPNIWQTRQSGTTGSYIITKQCMQYVLENIQGTLKEIDCYFIDVLQKKLGCAYCIIPPISYQGTGYSDIVQRNVNYQMLGVIPNGVP